MISESPEYRLFLKAFSERKAPLSIFLGSGLSRPAGLPDWASLEKKLRQDVEMKMKQSNEFGESFNRSPYTAMKSSTDPWLSFKFIKSILGEPTFNGLIEMYLTPKDNQIDPEGYSKLLQLSPLGVVSLNLDRFAGEAVSMSPLAFSQPIYGKELAEKWNVLLENKHHLVYLHGDVLNPSTWVLTKDDLDKLLKSEAHRAFLHDKFLRNLVLFVGIGADDAALSLRLLDLRKSGMRPPNIFWLTSRIDTVTQSWADENYVKLIRYKAVDDASHLTAIDTLVNDCLSFAPQPQPASPIANSRFSDGSIPKSGNLAQERPEIIRKKLSSEVDRIAKNPDHSQVYENYRKICKEYHFAIHQAFYRNDQDGFREWFDYRLSFPAIGRGNFGEVYPAEAQDGSLVAIKIMNETAFHSDEMLGGFRRGVRSMELIRDSDIVGMVPLIEAYELPPTIVMPFVPGLSLQEALEQRKNLSWETKIRIGKKVSDIVAAAHALPSTVMHRDLKPSNIMIENFEYTGDFDPEVKVLDFDMSWHKGSKEKDVIFESRDDFGFLCPEQTDPTSQYHAQTTKVDSYGFGMTLYFMFGHEVPLANEPMNPSWAAKVLRNISRGYVYDWKSAPIRLARFVTKATRVDQFERIDFFKLKSQLTLLEKAILEPKTLRDVEAWGEEFLARIGSQIPYHWDDDLGQGELRSPSGVEISVKTDAKEQCLEVKFIYQVSGSQERSSIPRFLRQSLDSAIRELKGSGWRNVVGNVSMGGLNVGCRVDIGELLDDISLINSADKVYQMLKP